MRLWPRRGHRADPPETGGIRGRARVDGRTKNLISRLQPREVAIINHRDIDRIAAEGLIERQPAAVINAAMSTSGRYPNIGALMLVSSGIPVIDDVGDDVMSVVEGATIVVDEGLVAIERPDGNARTSPRVTS